MTHQAEALTNAKQGERYSGMARNAEKAVQAGKPEQAAVAQVAGQNAGRIALDADRRTVAEAGEHIAAANRAIEEANIDPATGKAVVEARRIGNGGQGQQNMQAIKQSRDAYNHPEQNRAAIDGPQYTDAQNQQRLADAAKKASAEAPARIQSLKDRLAVTEGPTALSKVQRQQLSVAVQELEAAQTQLSQFAERGPTKPAELTTQDLKRASEMKTIEAGGHAREALKAEAPAPAERARLHDLAEKRYTLAHNELKNGKPVTAVEAPAAATSAKPPAAAQLQEHATAGREPSTAHGKPGASGGKTGGLGGAATAVVAGGVALASGASPAQAAVAAGEAAVPGGHAANQAGRGNWRGAAVSLAEDIGCYVGGAAGLPIGVAAGGIIGTGVAGPGVGTGIGMAAGGAAGTVGGCKVGGDALRDATEALLQHVGGGKEAGKDPSKVRPTPAAVAPSVSTINPQQRH